jgi:multiple sugar transport system permease protein
MFSNNKKGWLLLSPTIFILIIVGLVPFFYVLYVGFFKWNPLAVDPSMQFEGFGFNYRRLIFDGVFLESIWRSIKFSVVTLTLELSLGFLLAFLY